MDFLSEPLTITSITDQDRDWLKEKLKEHWFSENIVTKGRVINASKSMGFIASIGKKKVGVITYQIENGNCEIITLNSFIPKKSIGSRLIEEVKRIAKRKECQSVWVITTNDNVEALEFYRKQGFTVRNIYKNALEESRKLKPEIPKVGIGGIPLTDEIELQIIL